MINFKNKDEILPSALIVFALLVLLGSLAGLMALNLNPPSAKGVANGRQRSLIALQKQIDTEEKSLVAAEASARERVWNGDVDAVTAAVLAQLTRQAKASSLQLTAFRPQRLQPLEGLVEAPFSLQLTGSYLKVRALISALDRSSSRLVLRSFQFASTDAASDAVTATVNLSAYLRASAVTVVTPEKGGIRG